MEQENESAQEVVVEQEEQTTDELNLTEETPQEESVTISKAEFTKLKRKAIAYDSKKEEVKSEPPKKVAQTNPQSGFSQQDLEVTILKSQGMDDEALAYLKKVATVNGTSLIDAKKDDLFKAFVEKQEAEEKAKKASLGASRGSGKKEPVKTTGLSRDEHRERWEKQTGLNA